MLNDTVMSLTCRQCGKEFVFTKSEEEFYKLKGFVIPQHCKECRTNRRNQVSQTCTICGTAIPKGEPVHCSACLAAVQVSSDLEVRKMQGLLDESQAKVISLETEIARQAAEFKAKQNALESEKLQLAQQAEEKLKIAVSEPATQLLETQTKLAQAESDRTRLAGLLQKKIWRWRSWSQTLTQLNSEVEKSTKYRTSLEGLEPALNRISARLDNLERTQNSLNHAVLNSIQKDEENPEVSGLLELIKRFFRVHRRRPVASN